jgi:hypothetical protein
VRVRLRHALPVVQMLVAIGLYRWSDLWLLQAAQQKWRGEPYIGSSPGYDLLGALNAPLVFLQFLRYRLESLWHGYPHPSTLWMLWVPELVTRSIDILTVGMLWYWVARSIESLRQTRGVFTFSITVLRLSSDLLLILAGLFSGAYMLRKLLFLHATPWWSGWNWICCLLYFAWFVSLTCLFTRDFIRCIRRLGTNE